MIILKSDEKTNCWIDDEGQAWTVSATKDIVDLVRDLPDDKSKCPLCKRRFGTKKQPDFHRRKLHLLNDHSTWSKRAATLSESTEVKMSKACDEYLLQNVGAGYVGNSPVFWSAGGSGYTPWIDEAKRFTLAEAEQVIRSTFGSHCWMTWPVEEIEATSKRTVDIQDLRKRSAMRTETNKEQS